MCYSPIKLVIPNSTCPSFDGRTPHILGLQSLPQDIDLTRHRSCSTRTMPPPFFRAAKRATKSSYTVTTRQAMKYHSRLSSVLFTLTFVIWLAVLNTSESPNICAEAKKQPIIYLSWHEEVNGSRVTNIINNLSMDPHATGQAYSRPPSVRVIYYVCKCVQGMYITLTWFLKESFGPVHNTVPEAFIPTNVRELVCRIMRQVHPQHRTIGDDDSYVL